MFVTPDLSHIKEVDYDQVYAPAEDTFLLMDALESEWSWLQERIGDDAAVCVEIGPGSGCVSTFCAMHLFKQCAYFAVDINPYACKMTEQTAQQNKVFVNVIQGSLLSPLIGRLHKSVDLLLFNPPYVPTPSTDVYDPKATELDQLVVPITASWAGGEHGREVIDQFLPYVQNVLSERGVMYMVMLRENKIEEVADILLEQGQLTMTIVVTRRAGREHLIIARFCRL